MLKIVVFCGGTGSTALQKGLAGIYGINTLQLDIIVNAYDNGKSTGACRRILDGQILGPSDVRKNQLLQYALRYQDEMHDTTGMHHRLYRLFDVRLSAADPLSYYEAAQKEITLCEDILEDTGYLRDLLDFFFFDQNGHDHAGLRRTVLGESFEDFSLSNIFYASCAAMNGGSLTAAADKMAEILKIPSNVHLISDKNLILKAETASGRIIGDEGDIVAWNDPQDKIRRAILLDGDQEYIPNVEDDPSRPEHSIRRIVSNADLIIFSSGTQWSSLIPTYMHQGFGEIISSSKAKKYLVMNNAEDHDALGVSADELCEIISQYINMDELTVVLNDQASPAMTSVSTDYRTIRGSLSGPGDRTHDPKALVSAIMSDYYGKALSCRTQMFDLDGTLWDEHGTEIDKQIGRENLDLFQGMIVTGNSVHYASEVLRRNAPCDKKIDVFADYGNSHFSTASPDNVSYLTDCFFLEPAIWETVRALPPFARKAVLRGGVVITIKPLEDRPMLAVFLAKKLERFQRPVCVRVAGRTSLDITYSDYTKAASVEQIMKKYGLRKSDVLFIGNELEDGSEAEILELGVETLQVNDVRECNTYLRTRKLAEEAEGTP